MPGKIYRGKNQEGKVIIQIFKEDYAQLESAFKVPEQQLTMDKVDSVPSLLSDILNNEAEYNESYKCSAQKLKRSISMLESEDLGYEITFDNDKDAQKWLDNFFKKGQYTLSQQTPRVAAAPARPATRQQTPPTRPTAAAPTRPAAATRQQTPPTRPAAAAATPATTAQRQQPPAAPARPAAVVEASHIQDVNQGQFVFNLKGLSPEVMRKNYQPIFTLMQEKQKPGIGFSMRPNPNGHILIDYDLSKINPKEVNNYVVKVLGALKKADIAINDSDGEKSALAKLEEFAASAKQQPILPQRNTPTPGGNVVVRRGMMFAPGGAGAPPVGRFPYGARHTNSAQPVTKFAIFPNGKTNFEFKLQTNASEQEINAEIKLALNAANNIQNPNRTDGQDITLVVKNDKAYLVCNATIDPKASNAFVNSLKGAGFEYAPELFETTSPAARDGGRPGSGQRRY